RIEYIVTASGAEALLLESEMIKQHQPPFNVLLKDDKCNYPYLLITWSEDYPRLLVMRDKRAQSRSIEPGAGNGGRKDKYYGPFVDSGQLRETLSLVKKVFPLRQRARPLYKDKPCLNYDIGLCPGSCQGLISKEAYRETVRLAEMVFRGQGEELLGRLHKQMEQASATEAFERADMIKQQMKMVRGGLLGSALHFGANRQGGGVENRKDVAAVGVAGGLACFQIFRVRGGRLTGRIGLTYQVPEDLPREEVLLLCLERYWGGLLGDHLKGTERDERRREGKLSRKDREEKGKAENESEEEDEEIHDIPDEIVTADRLPEGREVLLSELLTAARKKGKGKGKGHKKVKVCVCTRDSKLPPLHPKPDVSLAVVFAGSKGESHHLAKMVSTNANLEASRMQKGSDDTREALSQLKQMLGLGSPPHRIEGFDISHTQGSEAVAGGVVFLDGKVSTKNHRRYRIRTDKVHSGHSDDYASLKEVVARRFRPPLPGPSYDREATTLPDVLLIDGGKGQLSAALEGASVAAAEWDDAVAAGRLEGYGGDRVVSDGGAGEEQTWGQSSADPDSVFFFRGTGVTSQGHSAKGESRAGSIWDRGVDVGGGRRVVFVSLAKKEEELHLPGMREALTPAETGGANSPGMVLLRQVRDEAHRFAISYHRKVRGRALFRPQDTPPSGRGLPTRRSRGGARSAGEKVEERVGLGGLPARAREELRATFGSLGRAREAGEAELRRVPGIGRTLSQRIMS
ncbi:unnamed protein product, partial [Discosporangium mesarthrocarpum]